jgi:CRISPR-associated protein Cas1
MKRDFYVFSNGRLQRKDNTLFFVNEDGKKKAIPLETVRSLYVFGEVDFNTKFFTLLSQSGTQLHMFNYYGFYSGSFIPRESLLSGDVLVNQVKVFTRPSSGIPLARELIDAAVCNILKNLGYYQNRGKDLAQQIEDIGILQRQLKTATSIDMIMGLEGKIRNSYYSAFTTIINQDVDFTKRVRRPPDNMLNTLISFGNSLLYTATLGQIYHTQLNPTVSFLHKPSYRRFSLALDVSEIFKPILVDRIIFRVLNRNMITESDFEQELNFCYMKERAKKTFVREFDQQLQKTIQHKKLQRHYSYRYLIRLECYKLIKCVMEKRPYEAFRIWW